MSLIRRKPEKKPHDHGLKAVALVVRALVAQRLARKAYKGYKWTRRLPFIVGGTAIVAFLLGLLLKKRSSGGADQSAPPTTASHPSTTETAASSPPATTPTTPTPTGSPTAVTPAPTAAADGAPEADSDKS
jgi:hypothetical protein